MLLILDIDETLIYASEGKLDSSSDFQFAGFNVWKRPHLDEFLSYCFANFSVAVWTTSTENYAVKIASHIFNEDQKPKFLWTRDHCTPKFFPETQDSEYLKDLKKVKARGYDLTQTIVVDNTPRKLARSYGNLVRITDFLGDHRDQELKRLQNYLPILRQATNVRELEKRGWQSRYPV